MAQTGRTFRVFVSSTFGDLKAERDALQERVFPRLRELCLQQGARFQAVDLRWGISSEAGRDQLTMGVCLDEIERCRRVSPRPSFIVLLGERYGWQPLPARIPSAEMDAILERVSAEERELLLWSARQAANARGWYRRDDNACPPQYVLLPADRDVPEDLPQAERLAGLQAADAAWQAIEPQLRTILRGAVRDLRLDPLERLKYEASATEQECQHGALLVPDAQEHVFCFFRTIAGLPRDRRAGDYLDLDGEGGPDQAAAERLARLKDSLRARLGEHMREYVTEWTGEGAAHTHLDRLCEDVYQALAGVLESELGRLGAQDPLVQERAAHRAFGRERTTARSGAGLFVGRTDILEAMDRYLVGGETHPLVIHGASGIGKTALLAQAAARADARHATVVVVQRHIGATPAASDSRSLLESLAREISRAYGRDEAEVPTEYRALVADFPDRLALASAQRPLFLFLDALDQLAEVDPDAGLAWLPATLPPHVRLVATMLPGAWLDALASRVPSAAWVELRPLPVAEGRALLNGWLAAAGRGLQPRQAEGVLARFERSAGNGQAPEAGGLPLYLKLAFEEARLWPSWDDLSHTRLSESIDGVIRDNLFARLSSEVHHGRVLVERALGYLAAARHGLTEDELLDVLSRDETVFGEFLARAHHAPPQRRLPPIVWSRLYFDLEPYLTERSADGTALLSFYHRQLRDVVASDLLANDVGKERHRALAAYFGEARTVRTHGPGRAPYLRRLSELPYQQARGGLVDALRATLCDLPFVEAKAVWGLVRDLVLDYETAARILPEAVAASPSWSDWKQFVSGQAHVFERYAEQFPQIVFQQAFNSSRQGEVARAAQRYLDSGQAWQTLWFERVNRPEHPPARVFRFSLEGHAQRLHAISITPDGRRFISGARDGSVRIWQADTGACLHALAGHRGAILWQHLIGNDCLLTAGWDGAIRVWDLDSGGCLRLLEGHAGPVNCVTALNRERAVSASSDGTLRWWDLASGQTLGVLSGHQQAVNHVVLLNDACAASAADDGTVRLWDLTATRLLQTLQGHTQAVLRLARLPGDRLASASADESVRIWDTGSGECQRELRGHRGPVAGLSLLASDRLASWSFDGTVRVWSLESGECVLRFDEHDDAVTDLVLLESDLVASASFDQTIRIWCYQTGAQRASLTGYRSWVSALAAHPGGSLASGSFDGTVRVWDWRAALAEQGGGGASVVPEIARARGLSRVSLVSRTTAVSVTTAPASYHLWDLVEGRCAQVGEEKSDLARLELEQLKTTAMGPFCATPPTTGWPRPVLRNWSFTQGQTAEGVIAVLGQPDPDHPGVWQYTGDGLAFYPLQCRPTAHVYDSDRTIAFEDGTREAHILLLRGFERVPRPEDLVYRPGRSAAAEQANPQRPSLATRVWRGLLGLSRGGGGRR
jgi:WD40 repeat protein